jgi:hypothetical protein
MKSGFSPSTKLVLFNPIQKLDWCSELTLEGLLTICFCPLVHLTSHPRKGIICNLYCDCSYHYADILSCFMFCIIDCLFLFPSPPLWLYERRFSFLSLTNYEWMKRIFLAHGDNEASINIMLRSIHQISFTGASIINLYTHTLTLMVMGPLPILFFFSSFQILTYFSTDLLTV